MKKIILIATLLYWTAMSLKAQIKFENTLSLTELKQKAKKENRYILIDCYATWCGPCKYMDLKVFTRPEVGNAVNSSFISAKFQMDRTANDSKELKARYADAKEIEQLYEVKTFPNYLFLSPNGRLVHRAIGAMDQNAFIAACEEATDPRKQFYLKLERYNNNQLSNQEYPEFIQYAHKLNEQGIVKTASDKYINEYLMHFEVTELLKPQYLDFISNYTQPKDLKTIEFFRKNKENIGQVMKSPEYVEGLFNRLAIEEFINPKIFVSGTKNEYTTQEPNWANISSKIKSKYSSTSSRNSIAIPRIDWYKANKQWDNLAKAYVQYFETVNINKLPALVLLGINSACWNDIFKNIGDKSLLLKAAETMKEVANASPKSHEYLDTYANLLYKAGKKEEAILVEKKALALVPDNKEYLVVIAKMEKGEPTWPTK